MDKLIRVWGHSSGLFNHISRRIDGLRILDKKPWFDKLEKIRNQHNLTSYKDESIENDKLVREINGELLLLDFNLGEARTKEDNYYNCIKLPLLSDFNLYKEEYPEGNINQYYLDQGYKYSNILGYTFSAIYTPYGIKLLDRFYFNEIIYSEFNVSNEDLENAIKKQPNLHNVIKTDLLANLKKYIEEGRR